MAIKQMGGVLTLGNYYQMQTWAWLAGQVSINTVVWKFTAHSGVDEPNAGDIAEAFKVTIRDEFRDIICNPATFLGTKVAPALKADLMLPGIYLDGAAGLAGDTPLPTQDCGLIKFTTALKGSGYRGRIFTPFAPTDAVETDGTVKAAYVALLQAYGDLLGAPRTFTIGGETYAFVPVVYHRDTGLGTFIVDVTAEAVWATQKGRGDLGQQNPKDIR